MKNHAIRLMLAVDPGPVQSAWVLWDKSDHKLVSCGEDLFSEWVNTPVDFFAIEFPQSYGVTAGLPLFITAFTAGRIAEIARLAKIPCALYGRPTIKGQIGGKTDAEIRASLRMRLGGTKKGDPLYGVKKDIWAALALAVALDERPDLKRVPWDEGLTWGEETAG